MLTWTKSGLGNSIYYTSGLYTLAIRKDGYYDVWHSDVGLNKSRVRLHAAKQIAEDHYAMSNPAPEAASSSSDETVLDLPESTEDINQQLQQEAQESIP